MKSSEILIGIISPTIHLKQIRETLRSFPNFKPIFRTIERTEQLVSEVEGIIDVVEVLLFTEYHLYKIAKENMSFTIPTHYIPLMGTGLYRALFLIKSNYGLSKLSVDTIEKKYVKQILSELKEENYELYSYDHHSNDLDEIIFFHYSNHKNYQTIALTGMHQISERLTALKIPHQLVTPTQQDMIVSLERALLSTRTRQNKESQIVFGLINVDKFRRKAESYANEHDVQLLKLKIQQMVLDYIKQLDAHFINLGGEEYAFITTRGIFERETRGYKYIPLLQNIKNHLDITLSLGVGFGQTAAEAGNHARLALKQSKELGGNVCYIVREDRSVIGPVDVTTYKQYESYELAITDPKLLDKAEKAGMSATYMTMLMARVARHNKIDYTAQELAETLNITIRSAHRILLKWMDADLVEIVGEEKVSHKGRPRRIYRLSFISEEAIK